MATRLPGIGFGPVVGPFHSLGDDSASLAAFFAAATAAAASWLKAVLASPQAKPSDSPNSAAIDSSLFP